MSKTPLLDKINYPHDLRSFDKKDLTNLAKELRDEMIDAVGDIIVFCLGLFEIFGVNGEEVLTKIVENNKTRSHEGHY